MNEGTLQALVEAHCRGLGLLHHHCRDARKCSGNRGLPDLIIAGESGILMPELKGETGETSAHQDLWRWTLTRAGVVAPIWNPDDWDSGLIHAALKRLAGRQAA